MLAETHLSTQFLYEALSRGKREWELTFDAVPDLIFITDTRHTITRVNRAMAERVGMHPSELPGRKCYEIFHGLKASPDTCPFLRLMEDGEAPNVEIEEKHLGGFFEISVSPLYNEVGELAACVHVARDITERKKAEEYRLALEQQLQQTQKLESLGVLTGGIAHDFNNILTIILGHCVLARNIALPDKTVKHLEQIEIAGNRAADLCRQMLTYAGKSPLVQSEIDLRAQVSEIISMLQPAFKKNVSFSCELPHGLPPVIGDRSQVQQIIMNIIVNAVEAIGDSKGTVRVALESCTVGEGDADFFGSEIPHGPYVRLQVSDTGCGMTEETQRRIFEPFFSTKFTGRGLGMSAIMGIIKSHKGALQLFSTPGSGTTFKVYFPVSAVSGEKTPRRDDASLAPGPREPLNGTVLLVDDEPELRSVGTVLLTALGCRVVTACNGREALEVYRDREGDIDLVVMDLTMPEMDGLEAYHELRKKNLSLPVLFCSGYGKKEVSPFIDRDRRAAFMAKPYRMDLLHEMLAKLWQVDRIPPL
ncbi:response regulator [Geomonas terrae]|uniref:histidine kinase n=1 Tax=Geomonas terrae TaxID=2562681 RepID=A0A4S1CKB6_9BACT|nr:response regulator [Geomonas terrae]TGU74119.1 response regulator [Geomonas terrae]